MEHIFSEDNVQVSLESLLTKGDSCGVDGIYVSQFKEYWFINKNKILNSIYDGSYVPGIVLEIEILKKNGKRRIISKYNSTDRVFLDVIKRDLSAKLEGGFSEYSYAYRENKGTYAAAQQAAKYIETGMDWVAEIDVRDFFDSINIERLCGKLKKAEINNDLYQLIHKYLYPMIQCNDFQRKRKTKGLIQGSPISPLLSNLYMQEFDALLESKYKFCRFSDNIYIYCEAEKDALEAIVFVENKLKELGLLVNVEKTGVFAAITRNFLGFQFYRQNGEAEVLVKHREK